MTAVGVFDLDEAVCDTHDINSVFSAQNFCKHPQNENSEQERRGSRRVEEWLIAGHWTKWEPETVRCQNYYRFILYLFPWALQCENINKRSLKRWVRDGGPESERAGSGENSNISWLLFRWTFCTLNGALRTCLYICPPHVGQQWVGCTFPSLALYLTAGIRRGQTSLYLANYYFWYFWFSSLGWLGLN